MLACPGAAGGDTPPLHRGLVAQSLMGTLRIVINFGINWARGGDIYTDHLRMEQEMPDFLQEVLAEFEQITTFKPHVTPEYMSASIDLCEFLKDKPLRPKNERPRWLLAHINRKFRLNQAPVAAVYGAAAQCGTTFNYHEKEAIQQAFDLSDSTAFAQILQEKGVAQLLKKKLLELFQPIGRDATVKALVSEVAEPSKLRREKGERQIDRDILVATLSSFMFSLAEEEVLHSYFDEEYSPEQYKRSFWLQLRANRPELYNRECTLEVVRIDSTVSKGFNDYASLQSALMDTIRRSYFKLNNHGYLAIWIDPLRNDGQTVTWQIVESVKLFAEKFVEAPLKQKYFGHRRVADETTSYVSGLNHDKAKFNLANEGFTYRDCFVLCPSEDSAFGSESLLVLFQKNQRDETPIPCPACRSPDVQGNSYPTLGVRSWECGNLLCPDRSKYNRGKRYSFKSLLMQEAITHPENVIPAALVKGWSRDVQIGREPSEIIEMLVRFYSLHGDSLHFAGVRTNESSQLFGRKVQWYNIEYSGQQKSGEAFFDSAWFHRYVVSHKNHAQFTPGLGSVRIGPLQLVHGDARTSLCSFDDNYFDGAVTSPPYYNAREYAHWPNIYCYLYDMFGVIKECYRVLKPGAFFLFNIFDNFDNERSIVFSAMGNKKLVLSSMLSDLFRRAGFRLCGSVVWDKGEIEGKRAFNGGNRSPYYQSPFNCWEHILIFGKLERGENAKEKNLSRLPSILRAQPVVKMIRGENSHGHTAPFPLEVPALLAKLTPPGSVLLDPFGGSGTTGRALCDKGMDVVCIERDLDYCGLAERMFRKFSVTGTQPELLLHYDSGLNLEKESIK